jgi:hypothetical protein
LKLTNEKGIPWGGRKQNTEEVKPLDFTEIQERSVFIGINIGTSYQNETDCVVLLYKDRTNWKLKTNENEDAFEFLYNHIKFFSKNRYQSAENTFLKEYLIFTIGACLSSPIKPEYSIRDVDVEKNNGNMMNRRWQTESFLKISDWLNHLPISGASKRVYLETSPQSNFPFELMETREIEKEKEFLVDALRNINEVPVPIFKILGLKEEHFKGEYFRNAFVSMLVSIAYIRWKSLDKSARKDFLKIVADHDGIYWLLDHESLNN